jgi:hypothetical protein
LGVSTKGFPWQAKSIHPRSSAMMKSMFGFFAHRVKTCPARNRIASMDKGFILRDKSGKSLVIMLGEKIFSREEFS